jgi:hypothetical protein
VKHKKPKTLIGRREQVDFPDLGLYHITAKVDTGAYTTVLHCHDISVRDHVLYFKLLDPTHPEYEEQEHCAKDYFQKEIKSSFGEKELRYIITARIKIGKRLIKSVVSLTNRKQMRYPVLIGRKLLKNRFVVDVSKLQIGSLHIESPH